MFEMMEPDGMLTEFDDGIFSMSMNGYEATKMIRETYPDIHIPIIALSANAFEEDRQKSFEAGMDDHVAKPIDIQKLKETLAKYL